MPKGRLPTKADSNPIGIPGKAGLKKGVLEND